MAITITTKNSNSLLSLIKVAIENKSIKTWSFDDDGDFTHCVDQWDQQAWLRPFVAAGQLRFGIIFNKNATNKVILYGIYHGRFIEMLLNHFDAEFSVVNATALLAEPDIF